MARIRTIKPEFWEDERIADLSPRARLLFIGTWNLADDEGLLRWTTDYLAASLFMYDNLSPLDTETLMAEVVNAGLIWPYTGGRSQQRLAYVFNFAKHQRINRPSPPKLPPPSLQSPAVREMYGDRDGWICHLCGCDIHRPGPDMNPDLSLEIDHVTPKVAGGTDYPSNLRAACRRCNRSKSGRVLNPSVNDSVSESVNDSRQEGKGREGKGGANTRPRPTCAKHPEGTDQPCRACGQARRAHDAWKPAAQTYPSVGEVLTGATCDHGAPISPPCPLCRRGVAA